MEKIQDIFTVAANAKICPQFYRMRINAPSLLKRVLPGQFIHLRVNEGLQPFFRRPFSVYRAKRTIDIFYEVVGPGTALLAAKKKGDPIDVLGPVGRPFTLPGEDIRQVVMVAGGIGVAPFQVLSDHLKARNIEMILLYGGRTEGHMFDMKDFTANGCRVHVATDDGSVGVKGRVDKLYKEIDLDPSTTMVYTCGPRPMMASVQAFARKHGLPGEAACEEVMACALGACLGCAIKTTEGFKTVCYDGPVFDLQTIDFGG